MRLLAGLVSCAVAIVQAVVAEDAALSSLVQRKRAGGDFERCTGHGLGRDPIESNVSLSDGAWSWCSGGEGTPIWPSSPGQGKVCCPATASWCSGCAEATEQGDGCAACLGGYVLQEGTCQPCMDLPHWSDASGANCFAVPRSQCSDARFRGLSSNKACCKCGGGLRSAAPFRYFVLPLVSGGGVKGYPLPRTGSSYSLDAGCQLLKYNLTIDGLTGSLKFVDGCDSVGCGYALQEPFTVKCTITAHQGLFNASAAMVVTGSLMAYQSSVLVVPPEGQSFRARVAPALYFRLGLETRCLPDTMQPLLDFGLLDRFELIVKPNAAEVLKGAGVTDLALAGLPAAPGGVCVIRDTEGLFFGPHRILGQVIVLAPETWGTISYGASSVSVAVGKIAQTLQAQDSIQGRVPPTRFSATCGSRDVSIAFDVRTGLATMSGYQLFTLNVRSGALSASPAPNLTDMFDSLQEDRHRASIVVNCTIWGHFEWQTGLTVTPVTGAIQIQVEDDTCWKQVMTPHVWWLHMQVEGRYASHGSCRAACRKAPACGVYHFDSNGGGACYFLAACGSPHVSGCRWAEGAYEKIGNCSVGSTCLNLSASQPVWLYDGSYCPLGWGLNETSDRALGWTYHKEGLTAEGSFYLQPADTTCSPGALVLTRPNETWDFQNVSRNVVELHGRQVACLSAPSGSSGSLVKQVFDEGARDVEISDSKENIGKGLRLSLQSPSCSSGALNLTVDEHPVPVTGYQEALLLDDPTTSTPYDFTLHPCECFPEVWGPKAPVTSQAFKQVPPGSGNVFAPLRIEILQGSAMCEQKMLLSIQYGVSDQDWCEMSCSLDPSCRFMWAGTLENGKQCRLYRDCEILVQPESARGTLVALPGSNARYCQRADPGECWVVQQRRDFLGAGTGRFGGSCLYEALAQQCDWHLMLGMQSVGSCYQCDYAILDDMGWQDKRPLPSTFMSGQQLGVSCWAERYAPATPATKPGQPPKNLTVACAAGKWLDLSGSPARTAFACSPCVQLVRKGYATYFLQNHQELYFTPSMGIQLLVDNQHPQAIDDDHGTLVPAKRLCLRYDVSGVSGTTCPDLQRVASTPGPGEAPGCKAPPDEPFLCQVSASGFVSACLFKRGGFWQLEDLSVLCPPGIVLSDYAIPCPDAEVPGHGSRALSRGGGDVGDAAAGLLQLYRKASCYAPSPVVQNSNYTTRTRNGTEYSNWQLRTVKSEPRSRCLEAGRGKSPGDEAPLRLAECQEPMTRQQAFGDATLRKALLPLLQDNGTASQLCPSTQWPNCNFSVQCPEDQALTKFSLSAPISMGCSTTPIRGVVDVEMPFSSVQFQYAGDCLLAGSSPGDKVGFGSCISSLSWWQFISTTCWNIGEMYVQVLRSASLDSLCFYLGGDGAVVLSCADLLNSDRFTCPEMSFDTPGRQLMQSGMDAEIRCFGFDGLEDCERADGRLAQQVQSASAFRVACPQGMLLSGMRQSQSTFESSSGGVGYTCVEASAMGSCLEASAVISESLTLTCTPGTALQSASFKNSKDDGWSGSLTCCYVASMVLGVPSTGYLDTERLEEWEGVYCPAARDLSGRLQYQQRSSFRAPHAGSSTLEGNLSFDYISGQWCLHGVDCAASTTDDPLSGLAGASWEVVAVTDFNGQYQASSSSSGTRPRARQKPALIQFHAEKVEVAEECKEEVPDWNTVGKSLSSENPCSYVTGKKADSYSDFEHGKGKGANWWEFKDGKLATVDDLKGGKGGAGYSYEKILDCWERQEERESDMSEAEFAFDETLKGATLVKDWETPGCFMIPEAADAPFGLGEIQELSEFCESFVENEFDVVATAAEMLMASAQYHKQQADAADCKGNHAAFARIWCDLHCVRSAVQEGDKAILASLEKAVGVLDTNVDRLLQYYTGLVGDKVDALRADVENKSGDTEAAQVKELKASLAAKLQGVRKLYQVTALDAVHTTAAELLLQQFMQDVRQSMASKAPHASLADHVEDVEAAAKILAHAGGLKASGAVAQNVARSAAKMQDLARTRSHMLGVYEHRALNSKARQQRLVTAAETGSAQLLLEGQASENAWPVILELDATWWALRAAFDIYLEKAKRHAQSYLHASQLLQDYVGCSAEFAEVRAAYGHLLNAEEAAEHALEEAWTSMLPLSGLLVSKLVDSNALIKLSLQDAKDALESLELEAKDCAQLEASTGPALNRSLALGLMGQTVRQATTMFGELLLLKQRSPRPLENMDVLYQSLERLARNLKQSASLQPTLHEKFAGQARAKLCRG